MLAPGMAGDYETTRVYLSGTVRLYRANDLNHDNELYVHLLKPEFPQAFTHSFPHSLIPFIFIWGTKS